MVSTLETFHFEMFKLNALFPWNTANLKEKRERGAKTKSERVSERKMRRRQRSR